jgi:hypothetical protein
MSWTMHKRGRTLLGGGTIVHTDRAKIRPSQSTQNQEKDRDEDHMGGHDGGQTNGAFCGACLSCATDFAVRFVGKHGNTMVLGTWRDFGPESADDYANIYWQAELTGRTVRAAHETEAGAVDSIAAMAALRVEARAKGKIVDESEEEEENGINV